MLAETSGIVKLHHSVRKRTGGKILIHRTVFIHFDPVRTHATHQPLSIPDAELWKHC